MREVTAAAAERWGRSSPHMRWHWRLALTGLWLGCLVMALVLDETICTASTPCGPELSFSLAATALISAPIFMMANAPGLAAAAAVVFAAADLVFDDVLVNKLSFSMCAFVWVLVAVRARVRRRDQEAILLGPPDAVSIDALQPERRPRLPWYPARTVLVLILVSIAAAAGAWFVHSAAALDQHQDRARLTVLDVARVSDDGWTIHGSIEGRDVVVDVLETTYVAGDAIPVFADFTGAEPWVELVAEPVDLTGWLTLSGGAALLALVLARDLLERRRALRQLLVRPAPCIRVRVRPADDRMALLLPVDSDVPFAQVAVGRDRVDDFLPLDWMDDVLELIESVDPGLDADHWNDLSAAWRGEDDGGDDDAEMWRGPAPIDATVHGRLVEGGVVVMVVEGRVIPVRGRVRHVTTAETWSPFTVLEEDAANLAPSYTVDGDGSGLPGHPVRPAPAYLPPVLWHPLRERLVGVALMAIPLAVIAAVVAGWFTGRVEAILWCLGSGNVGLAGVSRFAQVRLDRQAMVVRSIFRWHRVPWERFAGARRSGEVIFLAWDPEMLMTVGPFAGPGEPDQAAAAIAGEMMRRRELALAAGDAGGAYTWGWTGALPVCAAYVAFIVPLCWWVA